MGTVRSIFAAVAAGLVASACHTSEQYQASAARDRDARLASFNGSSMAAFSAQTGLLPTNAYPITNGRVFVVDGPTIFVTLPATHVTPAVTRSSVCRLLITTAQVGKTGTADDWEILGTQRSGRCSSV